MKKLILFSIGAIGLVAQTPTVLTPFKTGVSKSFQSYSAVNPKVPAAADDHEMEVPNQFYIPRGAPTVAAGRRAGTTSLAVTPAPSTMFNQTTNGTLPATLLSNYTGLGNGFNGWTNQGLLPPDTTMAVGNGQIVQWVNVRLTILNKTNGALLLGGSGYVNGNQIWSGLGGGSVCASQNQGDPVLQYDRAAGRWVLSQFAFTISTGTSSPFRVYPSIPYTMCFAVSQTNDATGVYNLYEFVFPQLTDYPKIGIWPDGIYFTTNDFSYTTTIGLGSYIGSRICALNKAAMYAGTATTAICYSGLSAAHFSSLPGDFEGSIAPPANTSAFIISGDWFIKNIPPYFLQLRRFKPDFVTPANSTLNDGFGGAFDSFISLPFDNSVVGSCGDIGGTCVPQPGTARVLETLSMRPMYRLAYRNMGANRESLVFTQSVDPAGAAVAGIQLVEIRNPAANPPQIYNNVNFNPDATNRWMGAAASDKLGNIGIGYSVSSTTLSPGIRIAGRARNDVRNTLRGEMNVTTGTGAQTSTSQRWGDYSTMQIDPDDDCTFWFTTEYMASTTNSDWATRIVSFRFNSCQ